MASERSRLTAAGSLSLSSANSTNIALFDEDTGEKPVGWVGAVKVSVMQVRLRFLASMHRLTPPVQLAFNPLNSHVLHISFRRRDEIHSWDLRSSTVIPLETFR